MGLLPSMLRLLVRECKKGIFGGDMLTLGQQSVCATYDEVQEIILSESIHPCKLDANLNLKSKIQCSYPGSNFTNAEVFFKLLGVNNLSVLDISAYEGADIICDLNYDIGRDLETQPIDWCSIKIG